MARTKEKYRMKFNFNRYKLRHWIFWLFFIALISFFFFESDFSNNLSSAQQEALRANEPPFSAIIKGRVRKIVDGDSLYINTHRPQIRLWGVDAPEINEKAYKAATKTLAKIAIGQYISCKKITIDKYGRTIARCFLNNGDEINRLMIESGTAKEYFRFTKGFYSR